MIKTEHLTVDYGAAKGVFDVTLSVPTGALYSLVGKSGCGKTTLLKALASLCPLTGGRFSLGSATPQNNRQLAYIQQQDALFPWLRVAQNVAIAISGTTQTKQKLVKQMLEAVGLDGYQNKWPHQLSGGQRQRVSIARSLATTPQILLMDEPTAALDAITKERLQELLLSLHLKHARTSLLVTHSIEEAVFMSQGVFIMDRGKIISLHHIDLPMTLQRRHMSQYYDIVRKLKARFASEVSRE